MSGAYILGYDDNKLGIASYVFDSSCDLRTFHVDCDPLGIGYYLSAINRLAFATGSSCIHPHVSGSDNIILSYCEPFYSNGLNFGLSYCYI